MKINGVIVRHFCSVGWLSGWVLGLGALPAQTAKFNAFSFSGRVAQNLIVESGLNYKHIDVLFVGVGGVG